jgi:hypothetical protein
MDAQLRARLGDLQRDGLGVHAQVIGPASPACVGCGAPTGHPQRKVCRLCIKRARSMRLRICNDPSHQGDRFIPKKLAHTRNNLCRACGNRRSRDRRAGKAAARAPVSAATLAAPEVPERLIAARELALALLLGKQIP